MADRVVSFYNGEAHIQFNEGRHVYVHVEKDEPQTGVTSVLKGAIPKDALPQWAANLASATWRDALLVHPTATAEMLETVYNEARFAHRTVAREAANKGSIAHDFCEKYPNEYHFPDDPQVASACEAFVRWYESHDIQVIEREKIVYSRQYKYCGTLDLLAMVDGDVAIVDYKTSSGLYREMPLQIAAYAIAHQEETGELVTNGWIIRLDKKTAKFEAHFIPISAKLKGAWLNCLDWYRNLKYVDDLTTQIQDATKEGRKLCQTSMKSTLAAVLT